MQENLTSPDGHAAASASSSVPLARHTASGRDYRTRLPLRAVLRGLALLVVGSLASVSVSAQQMNGFDLKGSLIPVEHILSGGPDKDGIPAIDKPDFVTAGFAAFLRNDDQVLGLVRGGVARAYPVPILNWHEVVNDRIGKEAVVITFCPLCGTGVAFDARVNGRELSFGVSGLLYNSDVLLYDRQTNSLWSQLLGQAISGPLKGQRLAMLPLTHTSWADWRKTHPATQVLSTNTGTVRPYRRNPYEGYEKDEELMFPVQFRAAGFHPKERVLGLNVAGRSKAYPFVELGKTPGEFRDRIGDTTLTIRFDRNARRATAHDSDGRQLAAVVGYWFAWVAFNPATDVFRAGEAPKPGLAVLANASAASSAAADDIVGAGFADPVRRYGHFAAGPPHEYARIEVSTASGAKLAHALPEAEVFEDVAPRLVRLASSQPIQVLAVVSHRDQGAALVLMGIERGRLKVVARSSPIGRPMRWLNPVGVTDLDGDGIAEIAAVITPHIGGTLTLYRRSGNRLKAVATLDGFSNHVYGSPELGLSMAFSDGGRSRLLVPDASRTVLRIIEYDGAGLRETGRCALREPIIGPIMAIAPGEIEVTQRGGRQRLRPADCNLGVGAQSR